MKPRAFLINTARGDLVNDENLIEALDAKVISGAGLDVFEAEPHVTPGIFIFMSKFALIT